MGGGGGGGHCLLCTCLLAGNIRLHTIFGVYIGLVQVVPMYQLQYKQSSNNRLCCMYMYTSFQVG